MTSGGNLMMCAGPDPEVRTAISAGKCHSTKGFKLLCWNPGDFSSAEIQQVNSSYFFLIGGFCVGKTTVLDELTRAGSARQIPEVKTRICRPTEEQGRQIESVSESEFFGLMDKGELMIGYEANTDTRRHLVGMRRETFRMGLRFSGHNGIIMHPNAIMYFLELFWIKILILQASPKDRELFRRLRGAIWHDGMSQNVTGSMSNKLMLPGELTHYVDNAREDLAGTVSRIKSVLSL